MFCKQCGAENPEGNRVCRQCGASLESGSRNSGNSSGTNLEPKVAGLLCYVLGWLTGLVFILVEKEDQFVRFHAMQSITVFGGLTIALIALGILAMIPYIGILFTIIQALVGIAGFVLWIMLMVKAYQGDQPKIPVAGRFAESHI